MTFKFDAAANTLTVDDGVEACRYMAIPGPSHKAELSTDPPMTVMRFRQVRVYPVENGWVLSVAWGTATHSDNHDAFIPEHGFNETPERVEVAAGRAVGDDITLVPICGEPITQHVSAVEFNRLARLVGALDSDADVDNVTPGTNFWRRP